MKLISLDNLKIFKNKLNFGTLENDYYIAGAHEPDISKCKIAFPSNQGYRNYSYNADGLFSTPVILIKEFKEFLNLFASFSKDGYIYGDGAFVCDYGMFELYNEGTESNCIIRSNGDGLIFFESPRPELFLSADKTITNVNLALTKYLQWPK